MSTVKNDSTPAGISNSAPEMSLSRRLVKLSSGWGLHAALLIFYLVVWEILVDSNVVSAFVLPAPSSILQRLWIDVVSIVTGGYMAKHFLITIQEILVGFGAALIIALFLGVAIAESRFFKFAVYPYVIAFNATPRVAFAPLFLLWFGFGIWSKVAMVIAISAFPVMVGTIAGMAAQSAEMDKLMRGLGATRWQAFIKVRVPLALPYIFAGVETGVVLAVIGAVVGEFAGGSAGLGYIILIAQQQLNLQQGFSALIILSLIGYFLHSLVLWLQRRVIYWRQQPSNGAAGAS